MSEHWRKPVRHSLWLLLGAAALLLVVAATNVAGLMLARGMSRRHELAVRAAMGASRGRTLALLSLEPLLAAAIGGGLGMLLGPVFLRAFVSAVSLPLPAYINLEMSLTALGITLLILTITAVIAALLPFLALGRIHPANVLRAAGRGTTAGPQERRWSRALVVFEVALATVVLLASALLLRSYQSLTDADLGFRTKGMLRVALFVNTNDAPALSDVVALQDRAIEAVSRLHAVRSVARIWPTAPLVAAPLTPIRYRGMDPRRVETGERVALYTADQAAFEVLDIAVLAGRVFTAADHADAEPVAVVSATLAQRLRGTERALGTVVEALGTERRVVGVVADARLTGPRAAPHEAPQLYLPLAQRVNRTVSFAIRAATDDAEALLPDVRRSLAAVAPTSAIDWADSFESALGEGFARDRFLLALTGVFSVISVLLAALGLFALLSFSVARAQTEIGVRQVLGATRASVVLGIVRGGVSLVAVGLALGLALSLLLSRVLAGIVYGIRPLDALAFTGTAATLVAVGVLASALPAWRAAAVSPAQAIRSE
jgi:predicted permease